MIFWTTFGCHTNPGNSTEIIGENPIEEIKAGSQIELISETASFRLNGKSWSEIETSGNSDTALTLYSYRILFTKEKDLEYDCLIRMNLIESANVVKALLPKIFEGHIHPQSVDHLIDSLNQSAIEYAETQVKGDIEEFGQSDGPCFELYSLKKN